MPVFFLVGLLAIILSLVLTPLLKPILLRTKLIAKCREKQYPIIPSGGGAAIFLAFWLTVIISGQWPHIPQGLFVSSLLILMVGIIDDKWGLSPHFKFIGQLSAAVILVFSGTRIEFMTNPFGGMVYLASWGIPLSLLWIVGVCNIVNFIDGLDGLAAGVTGIACFPLVYLAVQTGQPSIALLAIALAGSTFGFLPHNFNPARIIMGDTGSLFLGFMLAAISIEGALKGATLISLIVIILAMGVPLLDAAFAILRRVFAGYPIYQADLDHIHHKLLDLGFTKKEAVFFLYGLSILLCFSSLLTLALPLRHAALFFIAIVFVMGAGGFQIGLLKQVKKREYHN